MKRIIIGITGLARSGKDTAASFLATEKDFKVIRFADPVKAVCSQLYGIPLYHFVLGDRSGYDEYWQMTYREMLQKVGTDLIRNHLDTDFWVKRAAHTLSIIKDSLIVIPDVRFENEAAWIRQQGGVIIRLVRSKAGLPDELGRHVSESEIAHNNKDFIVENNSTVEYLYTNIEAIYDFAKFNAEAADGQ